MVCSRCGQVMRRINPEPEDWIRWTPLFWCVGCHHFHFGQRHPNEHDRPSASATTSPT
jgi:hypothetical protein